MDIKDKYRNLLKRKMATETKKSEKSSKLVAENIPSHHSVPIHQVKVELQNDASLFQTITIASSKLEGRTKTNFQAPTNPRENVVPSKEKQEEELKDPSSSVQPQYNKNESMTLTVRFEKKNLVISLKASLLASALMRFAKKEFQLGEGYALRSEGLSKYLELSKPLQNQVPQFDVLQVVKIS